MTESINVTVTRAAIQGMSDFDFDAVAEMVTDDICLVQPFACMGMPNEQHGKAAFVAGCSFVPMIFKEFKLHISEVYDCPDRNVVVFEQTSRGVFNVDGSEYANRYIMIFHFRAGKIAVWTEAYDSRIMTEKMTPIMAKMQAAAELGKSADAPNA